MSRKVGVTYRDRKKVKPYEEALRLVGLEPVLISPEEPKSVDETDGLLITGGTDVNPARYGQQPHPETQQPDDARDELESRLLQDALARDMPVLAICRGMQLFNVVHGGTLIQHLDNAEKHSIKPADPAEMSRSVHEVVVEAETRLAEIIGEGTYPVNSRHHQAVDKVGRGLVVAARSPDGCVEALERPDKQFAVAVEWHPENQVQTDEAQKKLFQAFADAVKS